MAKAQPALTINFAIAQRQITDLVNDLINFDFEFGEEAVKLSKVNQKELRAKLINDPKFVKMIESAIKDKAKEVIDDMLVDTWAWELDNFKYVQDAYEQVSEASNKLFDERQANEKIANSAKSIQEAVKLLKQAGYKVSE